jgi:uncharacterized protein with ParB-like and HNH nuclease domain
LFMATNADSTWEIVDGVQRLGTLAHFLGTSKLLEKVNRLTPLKIAELEKLSSLNDFGYNDLPKSVQLMFSTRPMRVTVLNDKSDQSVRFDLFERLNTGGVSLTNQEIRNCVFRGVFNNEIKRLVLDKNFSGAINLKIGELKNGTAEEYVLRFFAFLDRYKLFDHSVKDFLNNYMRDNASKKISASHEKLFKQTFSLLKKNLPNGIARGNRGATPVNLFEGIAVGTALALRTGKAIKEANFPKLLDDQELRIHTTGATNSKKAVVGRVEYVRDVLTK